MMASLVIFYQLVAIYMSSSFAFQLQRTTKSLKVRLRDRTNRLRLTELQSATTSQSHKMWNSPNSFTSPSFLSFSPWPNEYGGNGNELFYLPINSFTLTPGTDDILRTVTNAYIESDVKDVSKYIEFSDILDIIDSEYKWTPYQFSIGEELYDFNGKEDDKHLKARELFSKVISFAAFYRLPKEVTLMMLVNCELSGNLSFGVTNELKRMAERFDEGGWECVQFPQGLSVRLKREFLPSKRQRYSLIPRNSILTKTQDSLQAYAAIREATSTSPPPKLVQKEDIVAEIDEIAREFGEKSDFAEKEDSLFKDMVTFFPNRDNKMFARVARATSRQTRLLQAAGRAGLISYGFLNCMWYTLAIMWRWNRLITAPNAVLVQGKYEAIIISLRKFA